MKAMLMSQIRFLAAILSMSAAAGLAAFSLHAATKPDEPPAAKKAAPPIARAAESPEQIIARMIRTYASARSYQDEGEAVIVTRPATGKHTVKRPFSTKFVRPNRFRYEFTERSGDGEDELKRFVVWGDDIPKVARTWWTLKPKIEEASLHMSAGAGAGISGGSSTLIPAMLLPRAIPTLALDGLKEMKRAGEEVLDGSPCDKIEGKNIANNPTTVWVDKATSLLRRMAWSFEIDGLLYENAITYRPRINLEIAPDQFVFVPPNP